MYTYVNDNIRENLEENNMQPMSCRFMSIAYTRLRNDK